MPRGSVLNDRIEELDPKDQRDLIRNAFMGLPANVAAKEQVRVALGQLWNGGLYDGDTTLDCSKVAEASNLLNQLEVGTHNVRTRDRIVDWLKQL